MARDRKYGQVETEFGDFADDELVVLFRASDKLLPEVLYSYMQLCMQAGSPKYHIAQIEAVYQEVKAYQAEHENDVHIPTSQSYKNRTEESHG